MKTKIVLLFIGLAVLSCESKPGGFVPPPIFPPAITPEPAVQEEAEYVTGTITYIDEAGDAKLLFIDFHDSGNKIRKGMKGSIYHNLEGIKNEYSVGTCEMQMKDGKLWVAESRDLTDNIASGALVRVRVN
jgi:hypothetical protein